MKATRTLIELTADIPDVFAGFGGDIPSHGALFCTSVREAKECAKDIDRCEDLQIYRVVVLMDPVALRNGEFYQVSRTLLYERDCYGWHKVESK